MSINLIIFTALVCFSLILLFVFISMFGRGRDRLDDSPWKNDNKDQIYVGNLPYHIVENDLHQYFSRFGAIESVKIVRNFRTGHSKGYAFVTYLTTKQAVKALDAHGKDLQGRSLVVRIAKSREQQHAYT
ncbi:RNA-binding protein [Coxiella endosymbiont of Ornithodoros amblus]|uniref:RNA recognition motif domain-containing protein n=1 Tax=Coxiella endosymbiont of Ornithodoros amblus TaxID=1656166 RepID=UPI00244DEFD3|nr:RNA-binding protein [Coxiella endosymbiont of Ornithodoros amblus]MBW5802725.1 RNA-binding protein [Coxiella endosymbiont of Ornithodoros amblus]